MSLIRHIVTVGFFIAVGAAATSASAISSCASCDHGTTEEIFCQLPPSTLFNGKDAEIPNTCPVSVDGVFTGWEKGPHDSDITFARAVLVFCESMPFAITQPQTPIYREQADYAQHPVYTNNYVYNEINLTMGNNGVTLAMRVDAPVAADWWIIGNRFWTNKQVEELGVVNWTHDAGGRHGPYDTEYLGQYKSNYQPAEFKYPWYAQDLFYSTANMYVWYLNSSELVGNPGNTDPHYYLSNEVNSALSAGEALLDWHPYDDPMAGYDDYDLPSDFRLESVNDSSRYWTHEWDSSDGMLDVMTYHTTASSGSPIRKRHLAEVSSKGWRIVSSNWNSGGSTWVEDECDEEFIVGSKRSPSAYLKKASVLRFKADGYSFATASQATIELYADYKFTYAGERVASVIQADCCGGTPTVLYFDYDESTMPWIDLGPGEWWKKITITKREYIDSTTLGEGTESTQWVDKEGRRIGEKIDTFQSTGSTATRTDYSVNEYSSIGQLTQTASEGGVTGISTSADGTFTPTYATGAGRFVEYDYFANTGSTSGMLDTVAVKKGSTGTPSTLSVADYKEDGSGNQIYLGDIATEASRYPNEGSTATKEEVTIEYPTDGNFASQFYQDSNGNYTLPRWRVEKTKIGTSQYLERATGYLADRKTQWTKDDAGVVTFYEYYTSGTGAGQVKNVVRDIDTSSAPGGVTLPSPIPAIFATSSGDNLLTSYVYDDEGEVSRITHPDGTQTHYLTVTTTSTTFNSKTYGCLEQQRVYHTAYSGGTYSLLEPVSISYRIPDGETLSTQRTLMTFDSASAGPAAADTIDKVVARTDNVHNAQGKQTGVRVYPVLNGSGEVDTSTYDETTYTYNWQGDIESVEDPEGATTYQTDRYVDLDGGGSLPLYHEQRSYPPIRTVGMSYVLDGAISVSWTDPDGRTVQSSTATATVTSATPTGTETLTELSRTTYTYDDRGRTATVRQYFDLTSLDLDDVGTEGTNYYKTEYLAYDNLGRVLRVQGPSGDISATVYDAAGRAIEQWVGTNATNATRTDPSGGGTGGNNMVKVSATFYDTNGDGTGTPTNHVTRTVRLKPLATLAGTTADYIGASYVYDDLGQQTWVKPESGAGVWSKQDYDNDTGNVTKTYTYINNAGTQGALIGYSEMDYDTARRPTATRVYEVVSGSSTGDYLLSTYVYDDAGRQYKQVGPDGSITKSEFDAAGRTLASYLISSEGATSAITDDIVQTEQRYVYDDAGRVIQVTSYSRNHDASGATGGRLSDNTSIARITYGATWYDSAGRQTHMASYGTNGGSAFTRPGTPPEPDASDNILVSKYAYDTAGRVQSVTDNLGIVTYTEYDALGRTKRVIENYIDGTPGGSGGDAEDRVTAYTYNSAGQMIEITADLPSAQTDQTTKYVYSSELTDKGSPVKSNGLLRAVVYPDSDDVVSSNALANGTDTTYDRVEMTYLANGALYTRKDQRGVVLTHSYDVQGRRTAQEVTAGSVPGVEQIKYSFDTQERLEKVTSYSVADTTVVNEVQYAYNGYSQPITEYQAHTGAVVTSGGGASPKVQYAYDATVSTDQFTKAHRMNKVTYPNGRDVHLLYTDAGDTPGSSDTLSRVTALSTASTRGTSDVNVIAAYERMGDGMTVRKTYPTPEVRLDLFGGTPGSYAGLDRFGRTIDHRWENYDTPADLSRIKHGYDRGSNRLYREDTVGSGKDELYGHDDLQRLTGMDRGTLNGGKDSITSRAFALAWTLSSLGNWNAYQYDSDGNTGGGWELEQTRTHNDANEITVIGATTGSNWADPAHDLAGNMTTITKPNAPTETFTGYYDAWNRLTKLTNDADSDKIVGEYEYDGLGRRIVKKVYDDGSLDETRHMYHSAQWQVIEERVDGVADADMRVQYVWAPGSGGYVDELVSRGRDMDDDGDIDETVFVLQDANFNVTAIVSDAGVVLERYQYTPYGLRTVLNANFTVHANPAVGGYAFVIGHQGLCHDIESGLIENRNRVLHPGVGRFMQRDPLGYVDGMSVYQYVRSSPLSRLDLWGQASVGIVGSDAIAIDAGVINVGFNSPWLIGFEFSGGIQPLLNCKSAEMSIFMYGGGGLTIGSPGPSLTVNVGLSFIWNLPSNRSYREHFFEVNAGATTGWAGFYVNGFTASVWDFTSRRFSVPMGFSIGYKVGTPGFSISPFTYHYFWEVFGPIRVNTGSKVFKTICCKTATPTAPSTSPRAGDEKFDFAGAYDMLLGEGKSQQAAIEQKVRDNLTAEFVRQAASRSSLSPVRWAFEHMQSSAPLYFNIDWGNSGALSGLPTP